METFKPPEIFFWLFRCILLISCHKAIFNSLLCLTNNAVISLNIGIISTTIEIKPFQQKEQ